MMKFAALRQALLQKPLCFKVLIISEVCTEHASQILPYLTLAVYRIGPENVVNFTLCLTFYKVA